MMKITREHYYIHISKSFVTSCTRMPNYNTHTYLKKCWPRTNLFAYFNFKKLSIKLLHKY